MLVMIVKVLLLVNTVLIVTIVWDLLMKSTNIIKLVQHSIVILQHGLKVCNNLEVIMLFAIKLFIKKL